MKEKFLHFIWRFQLFQSTPLFTTDGSPVSVESKGLWNKVDAGPDFSMARIRIGNEIWVGNLEIHVKSSDWNLHNHSVDKNYENIILHVVYEHDKNIGFLESRNIKTLELKNYIAQEVLSNYESLLESEQNFIPCEKSLHLIQQDSVKFWLERMVIERLERKTEEIEREFIQSGKNWEELLFKKMAYAFGLKINAEAFLIWASSFDFKILNKVQTNPEYVYALFFGQAGFLNLKTEGSYIQNLQKNYLFLKSKFGLNPLDKHIFKFFRLRPPSFPTVRMMQLATIYVHYQNVFAFLMGTKDVKKIRKVFNELEYPDFWENHFRIEKESSVRSKKEISNELIDRIIINVIIPLKFIYAKHRGVEISEELLEWLRILPPEKNTIIHEFKKLGLKAENAFETQAYLELKNHFCNEKKCLNCALGLQILKNV
ncbi:DUF2851 family protein [Moheibacter sp.]|uniref:DUF2851 family protein n=1 Tax=Moheibacter sp. TaxID=1965316 RepID=UPI003C75DF5E